MRRHLCSCNNLERLALFAARLCARRLLPTVERRTPSIQISEPSVTKRILIGNVGNGIRCNAGTCNAGIRLRPPEARI
jgi:hypothetical protein